MAPHEEGPSGSHSDPHGAAKFPIHGTLMWTSYLVLFPLGTFLIRTSSSPSPSPRASIPTTSKGRSSSPLSRLPSLTSVTPFTRHWIPQAIATLLSLTGALIGLSHTHWSRPKSLHTILGSLIQISLLIQVTLGWRHHVAFLRVGERTWMAKIHIWLGRAILLMGWTNILVGMSHHRHEIVGVSAILLVGGLIVFQVVGLGVWIWVWERGQRLRGRKNIELEGEEAVGLTGSTGNRAVGDEYFELGVISDDDGDESDDDDDGKKEGK